MKKICYVTTISMSIDVFFIPQLRYLAENGFDVTVVCSPDDGLQERLGNTVRYVPVSIPRGVSVLGTIKAIDSFYRFFNKEQFDLIQYSTPNAAFCASIAAKSVHCPVRNYHLMGFRYLGEHGLLRFFLKTLEKTTCACSTHIECVSQSNLELGLQEELFTKEKAMVVWNGSSGGVDINRFDYSKREIWRELTRKELSIKEDAFVYGYVGRITKDKGINELLEAFFSLHDESMLLVVGNEEGETLNKSLLNKAKKTNKVVFVGYVQDTERYYAAMDVLILPSYREGFGMVVAEAAAVGTPSIVSRIPGPIDAVIEGKTALVIPVQDSAALAEQMIAIRGCDVAQMGRDAAEFITAHFDDKRLNQKILERKTELLEEAFL